MKILLDKSNSSLESSILLKDEEHYASSVHCSYYSCIQLMRHIIFNVHNEDETYFDNNSNVKNTGSHEFLISNVAKRLYELKIIDVNKFKKGLRTIKELRKRADYKQIVIFERDCEEAYTIATDINRTLRGAYKI